MNASLADPAIRSTATDNLTVVSIAITPDTVTPTAADNSDTMRFGEVTPIVIKAIGSLSLVLLREFVVFAGGQSLFGSGSRVESRQVRLRKFGLMPYLAVIADSFRAAFSSRVLWVALAAIYVFLAVTAPIGFRDAYTTDFRSFDIDNGTRMKALLAQGIGQNAATAPTPASLIAGALPEELRQNLRQVAAGEEVRIRLDLLAEGLNDLLDRSDWYATDVWAKTTSLRELRELDAKNDDLAAELKRRRARLRIEAALPGVFVNRNSRGILLTYAGFDFPAEFQLDAAQFKLLLNHFVLRAIIDWMLGFLMIFLGILVTASIVPDMLLPGSLHLLLSKPISRTWLFLAKFIGGCCFVLVCASQLIIGLWLIAGFRLGIWNARLLLCIPVVAFLFAVFYSVSAVAGLRWRSPILSIGLASVFFAICVIIGIAGGVSDTFITDPDRIDAIVAIDESVIASTRGADLRRFDLPSNRWVNLFEEENSRGDRVLAPVTLSDGRIATARIRGGRMNLFGSGATPLLILDPKNEWKPAASIELPTATSQLFATGRGDLIALNSSDLMIGDASILRIKNADPGKGIDNNVETPAEPSAIVTTPWLPKLLRMMGGATEGFQSMIPPGVSVAAPRSLCFSPDGESVFIYSNAKIVRLDRPADGPGAPRTPWPVAASVSVDAVTESVTLRIVGDRIVLFRSDASPIGFEKSLQPFDLKIQGSLTWESTKWTQVISIPNQNIAAVLTPEGDIHVLRLLDDTLTSTAIRGVSGVDTVAWDEAQRLLLASYDVDRLAMINLDKANVARRIRASVSGWRLFDRYAMTPIRTVTPQTSELGDTIATIVSGESTLQLPFAPADSSPQRYQFWRPVYTCTGFIVVMLAVGCIYFARTDF